MKRETLFLKIVLFFIGASVLALCIFWLPDVAVEAAGRYQQAVYLPVIIGMYAAAIPFYFVLYQAFNLLLYIDRGKAFSELSVTALKRIKFCALAIGILFAAFSPCLYIMAQTVDAPGIPAMGLMIASASIVISVFAAVLQKLLKNAIAIKSENDLTI